MDIGATKQKLTNIIRKYKYAALILVIGLLLMTLPERTHEEQKTTVQTVKHMQSEVSVSEELAKILTSIEGVGKVEVMLTVASGAQTLYQTDANLTSSKDENTSRHETVIITDSNRNEMGLVVQIIPEKYQGAIVVCQGAGSPSVQLAVINAVSNVTGLSSDRICVLKMK